MKVKCRSLISVLLAVLVFFENILPNLDFIWSLATRLQISSANVSDSLFCCQAILKNIFVCRAPTHQFQFGLGR